MPGQNRDSVKTFCGIIWFIIFLMTAFMLIIFAVNEKDYTESLAVAASASFGIAIFCLNIVFYEDSEEDLGVDAQEESSGEEMELNDMPVSRADVPGMLSLEYIQHIFNMPSSQASSEESSRTDDDPDIQEIQETAKLSTTRKRLASSTSGNVASSEKESRILETAVDVHPRDEIIQMTDSSSKEDSDEATFSDGLELQTFRLSKLRFMDSDNTSSEEAEGIPPQVTLSIESNDEADLAQNESKKEM